MRELVVLQGGNLATGGELGAVRKWRSVCAPAAAPATKTARAAHSPRAHLLSVPIQRPFYARLEELRQRLTIQLARHQQPAGGPSSKSFTYTSRNRNERVNEGVVEGRAESDGEPAVLGQTKSWRRLARANLASSSASDATRTIRRDPDTDRTRERKHSGRPLRLILDNI